MLNDSATYAAQVNAQTTAMQTTINDSLFGWVNGTTVTLNNTLVAFYEDVQSTVELVFGGTLLENPAREFVRCLIGTKVEGLENALTFIHDNLKVNMPTVDNDVLLLSNSSVDSITGPISLAAVGDSSDSGSSGGIVGRVIARYIASLEKERFMFLIFLGLWGFVVLIALCIVLWHTFGARWLHAKRQRTWEQGHSFGPFSRRPSEQSNLVFPGVPGGRSFDAVRTRPLWEEEGKGTGLKKLFGASGSAKQEEQMPSPKWADGQNVHAAVHVRGGAQGGWVGRLKSAMAKRKAESENPRSDVNMPFTNVDLSNDNHSFRSVPPPPPPAPVPTEQSNAQLERAMSSTWSVSPTAPPAKPWQPLGLGPKANAPPAPPASRPELTASFVEDARAVIYEQSALPLHTHFSTRSPSPPIVPPGLPNQPPASRQVPPVSFVPGGRIPRRHQAQKSSINVDPFATPFDDDRRASGLDGRYPLMGRAI